MYFNWAHHNFLYKTKILTFVQPIVHLFAIHYSNNNMYVLCMFLANNEFAKIFFIRHYLFAEIFAKPFLQHILNPVHQITKTDPRYHGNTKGTIQPLKFTFPLGNC